MSLFDRINEDFKIAYKAKQDAVVSTLRLLKSALKNKQIELMRELTHDDVVKVIKSQVKELKDSIVLFQRGERDDLERKALAELELLQAYMPEEMDDVALEEIVKQTIARVGAQSKSDMGKVMAQAMQAVSGNVDGGRVKQMVERLLPAVTIMPIVDLPLGSMIELLLRIGRIGLVILAISCVVMLLRGGFVYMNSSGRDYYHQVAWRDMTVGTVGTIFIACMFTVATIALQKFAL